MKDIVSSFIVVLLLSSVACKKEDDTFPIVLASVTSHPISSVTSSTATGSGEIIDDGGATITSRGVCYGTNSQPTIASGAVASSANSVSYTCNITGLTPNTTYYLRAYATNSKGTGYSTNEIVFKTLLAEATLTTSLPTSVTGNDATLTGTIVDDGADVILTRGICFGLNASPTLSDSVITSLVPNDSFTVTLPGLQPTTTYYARAFATSSSGTGYGNEITFTTTEQVFAIGEYYNGGIIFYLDDSQIHGLICATNDQSTSADWGCAGTTIAGADGIAVGDGLQNTLDIIGACSSTVNAASVCANLFLKGYSDWQLPSKGDLDLMNQNLHVPGLATFSTISYWSSTEFDINNAASFNFSTGTQSNANKNSPYAVRAIRSF